MVTWKPDSLTKGQDKWLPINRLELTIQSDKCQKKHQTCCSILEGSSPRIPRPLPRALPSLGNPGTPQLGPAPAAMATRPRRRAGFVLAPLHLLGRGNFSNLQLKDCSAGSPTQSH